VLDRAVLAAYASVDPAGDWDEAWADAWYETGAGAMPEDEAGAATRREIDERVLGNLLRLNGERSGGGE
jgi:hypothetical protein